MLIFVIAFNLGLILLNLYLIYCLRRWRRYLQRLTYQLHCIERYCDRHLPTTPQRLAQIQSHSNGFRQILLQGLQLWLQAQSLLWAIGLGFQIRRQKPN